MQIFECGNCRHALFFENATCENCGHLCGYSPADGQMLTFDPADEQLRSDRENAVYTFCANHADETCNWLLEGDAEHRYCVACQYNRTIPNLATPVNRKRWRKLEVAKHRLVYQLQRLGLSPPSKLVDEAGMCFDFVEQDDSGVMTGHADGVVTILLEEADSAFRERMRKQFNERYRTLIGHLRHEVGHYFWNRLVRDEPGELGRYRAVFGDERADYGKALKTYYAQGAPPDWEHDHITKYATAHPWEDWAETWAHYLHIMDMVETAYCFRLAVDPVGPLQPMRAAVGVDPYTVADFQEIIEVCVPVSYAVNSINRAMGLSDLYPFVISKAVSEKLGFIHRLMLPRRAG